MAQRLLRSTAFSLSRRGVAPTSATCSRRCFASRPNIAVLGRILGSERSGVYQSRRTFAAKTEADSKIEELTELYAEARDEFEIAAEETEKNTTYGPEDRQAAREALDKLNAAYNQVVQGEDKELGEEVKRRIGQRIRELDNAVVNMEKFAASHD